MALSGVGRCARTRNQSHTRFDVGLVPRRFNWTLQRFVIDHRACHMCLSWRGLTWCAGAGDAGAGGAEHHPTGASATAQGT
jgi:hypothetical protein